MSAAKSINEEHARLKAKELEQELTAFLDAPHAHSELTKEARQRARLILAKLGQQQQATAG